MLLSSPTLTKADDGVVHGVSNLWLDPTESSGKQLERFSLRLTQFNLGLLQCLLGFNRILDGGLGSN